MSTGPSQQSPSTPPQQQQQQRPGSSTPATSSGFSQPALAPHMQQQLAFQQYHSPSMSSYNYPQPGSDMYNNSPSSNSHMTLPSISLPPIHTVASGQAPLHLQSGPMGSHQPLAPSMQHYYQSGLPGGQGPQALMPSPMHQGLPFGHPANDPRLMSGGRHKKEIKRRTKTGCLTCRKRRIKCDEQHPKCRNCIKSKRECLGYDPIFKPASQQGGSATPTSPSGPGAELGQSPTVQSIAGLPSAVTQSESGVSSPILGPNIVAQLREAAAAPTSSPSSAQSSNIPPQPQSSSLSGSQTAAASLASPSPSLYQAQAAGSGSTAHQTVPNLPYTSLPDSNEARRNPPFAALSIAESSPSATSLTESYDTTAIDPTLDVGPTSAPSSTLKRPRDGSASPSVSEKDDDDNQKAKRMKINDVLHVSRAAQPHAQSQSRSQSQLYSQYQGESQAGMPHAITAHVSPPPSANPSAASPVLPSSRTALSEGDSDRQGQASQMAELQNLRRGDTSIDALGLHTSSSSSTQPRSTLQTHDPHQSTENNEQVTESKSIPVPASATHSTSTSLSTDRDPPPLTPPGSAPHSPTSDKVASLSNRDSISPRTREAIDDSLFPGSTANESAEREDSTVNTTATREPATDADRSSSLHSAPPRSEQAGRDLSRPTSTASESVSPFSHPTTTKTTKSSSSAVPAPTSSAGPFQ